MATLIKMDGALEIVHPKDGIGKPFKLEELQGYVGGYIESVYLDNGTIMLVNEEGMLRHLDPNPRAALIAKQRIVGDVLIVDNKEFY